MKLPCKNEIEGRYFLRLEVVFFSGGIAYEVEEQLEEGSLMVRFALFSKASVEYRKNGLKSMLKEDV